MKDFKLFFLFFLSLSFTINAEDGYPSLGKASETAFTFTRDSDDDFFLGGYDSETTDGSHNFSVDNFRSEEESLDESINRETLMNQLRTGDSSQKLDALDYIKKLIRPKGVNNAKVQLDFIKQGLPTILIEIFNDSNESRKITSVCEVMAYLAYKQKYAQEALNQTLPRLFSFARTSDPTLKSAVVWAVFNIISNKSYGREVSRVHGFLELLPDLLQERQPLSLRRRAAGIVLNLAKDGANRRILGKNGVITPLVKLAYGDLTYTIMDSKNDRINSRQNAITALKQLAAWNSFNQKSIRRAKHIVLGKTCCCC